MVRGISRQVNRAGRRLTYLHVCVPTTTEMTISPRASGSSARVSKLSCSLKAFWGSSCTEWIVTRVRTSGTRLVSSNSGRENDTQSIREQMHHICPQFVHVYACTHSHTLTCPCGLLRDVEEVAMHFVLWELQHWDMEGRLLFTCRTRRVFVVCRGRRRGREGERELKER